MKTKILLLTLMSLLIVSCKSDFIEEVDTNNVLMLKVDYLTNSFEGGTEFHFPKQTDHFTIINEYVQPNDFGSVKLIYKELNEPVFEGTIHWMGLGKMTFPESLQPANAFKPVNTFDLVYPTNGFENVFNPNNQKYEYENVWLSVQGLVKVRAYLQANPAQQVKLFLYTPSVGVGDPADWYWIVYLKR